MAHLPPQSSSFSHPLYATPSSSAPRCSHVFSAFSRLSPPCGSPDISRIFLLESRGRQTVTAPSASWLVSYRWPATTWRPETRTYPRVGYQRTPTSTWATTCLVCRPAVPLFVPPVKKTKKGKSNSDLSKFQYLLKRIRSKYFKKS